MRVRNSEYAGAAPPFEARALSRGSSLGRGASVGRGARVGRGSSDQAVALWLACAALPPSPSAPPPSGPRGRSPLASTGRAPPPPARAQPTSAGARPARESPPCASPAARPSPLAASRAPLAAPPAYACKSREVVAHLRDCSGVDWAVRPRCVSSRQLRRVFSGGKSDLGRSRSGTTWRE